MSLKARLVLTFLGALALTILPLPDLIVGFRPPWILLAVLYVQFYLPNYFHWFLLVLLGLVLDVLLSTTLGEHIFTLTCVCWLASTKSRRFYLFSIGQQMGLIAVAVLIYQTGIFSIDIFLGYYASLIDVLGSTVISVLIWPWIRLLAEDGLLTTTAKRKQYINVV